MQPIPTLWSRCGHGGGGAGDHLDTTRRPSHLIGRAQAWGVPQHISTIGHCSGVGRTCSGGALPLVVSEIGLIHWTDAQVKRHDQLTSVARASAHVRVARRTSKCGRRTHLRRAETLAWTWDAMHRRMCRQTRREESSRAQGRGRGRCTNPAESKRKKSHHGGRMGARCGRLRSILRRRSLVSRRADGSAGRHAYTRHARYPWAPCKPAKDGRRRIHRCGRRSPCKAERSGCHHAT
mmetsp:Transcript_5635/g.34987  ORF Transcript_5635/g.34987 Transcript_5635/m.34987 type:complete len:236 (-) Transcript_5635:2590-3297(-)